MFCQIVGIPMGTDCVTISLPIFMLSFIIVIVCGLFFFNGSESVQACFFYCLHGIIKKDELGSNQSVKPRHIIGGTT
jgi:hypothetical protein